MTPPPYHIIGPQVPQRAVVISVPHAGRYYPPEVLSAARVTRSVLERLEDRYVDALALGAAAAGFTVIIADVARACIDLNRDEDEWDSQLLADGMTGGTSNNRVRAGLGIVPTRLHPQGELWRQRMARADLELRLETVHRPWHRSIALLLQSARNRFGAALLIDLHSMPRQPGDTPQFVVGDRHGQTASVELVDRMLGLVEGHGLSVARNVPYAGAHGILRHGRRDAAVEAVQLEFDRSLYLAADGSADAARVATLGALVARIAALADAHITSSAAFPLAAE